MDERFDPEIIQQRVLTRNKGTRHISHQSILLGLNIAFFFAALAFMYGDSDSPFMVERLNSATGYSHWTPSGIAMSITLGWMVLIFVHILWFVAAYFNERRIRKEIKQETQMAYDLERMRLQVELAQAQRGEKAKRGLQISDEGEIMMEEELPTRHESHRR
jgi:hypothetical protein